MATTRPFAYDTGGPISGTTNFGSTLISGDIEVDYSEDYGGVKWWMGPDEDLGYVIGNSRPGGQPIPSGVTGTAQLGFWRSKFKTNESFLDLANYIGAKNGQPPFANTTDAENWLNSQGYYSSYDLPTPTPTPTITQTPTPSATSIPVTPTNTETPTPTPTATDLSSITTYTISGCSSLNVFVADLGPGALAPGDVFYFDFTGGTPSGCYRIVNKIDTVPSDGTTPLYFYVNCSLCLAANTTPTPTPTMTQTPTETETPTPTPTNTETPTNTPTPTTTATPTATPVPKFTLINNSTGNRTITNIAGGGFWTLTTGTYPVGAGQTGYGLTHPALTTLGLDQLAILFDGSDPINISMTKNGSAYTASTSVPTTNITASQINYFINNPSDIIQTTDVIVITISDYI